MAKKETITAEDIVENLEEVEAVTEKETAEEEKLLGRFPNNEKGVKDLENHAKHFQSEADKYKARVQELEKLATQTPEVPKAPTPQPQIDPPEYFDPADAVNPGTPSGNWLQQMIEKKAEAIIQPQLEQYKQAQQAQAFLEAHPELLDPAKRENF